MNLKKIEFALEKLEKAQSILAGARLWSVSEVEDEASRADSFIDEAASYLRELVDAGV